MPWLWTFEHAYAYGQVYSFKQKETSVYLDSSMNNYATYATKQSVLVEICYITVSAVGNSL